MWWRNERSSPQREVEIQKRKQRRRKRMRRMRKGEEDVERKPKGRSWEVKRGGGHEGDKQVRENNEKRGEVDYKKRKARGDGRE